MCGCLSHTPYWGPGLQPRHVPWLGIEPRPFGSQAGAQSTEPHQPGQVLIREVYFFPALILPSWKCYRKISNIVYIYKYLKMQKKHETQSWRMWTIHILEKKFFQNFHFLHCHLLQVSYFFLSLFWPLTISKKPIHFIKVFNYSCGLYIFSTKYLHSLLISPLYFLVCISFSFSTILPEVHPVLLFNKRTTSWI